MSDTIDQIDPFLPLYALEKAQNPDKYMVLRSFKRRDVEDVDKLVEISRGNRDAVTTEDDWTVVRELFNFWAKRWPEEYAEFRSVMPDIRKTRNAKGYSKNKEMMYVGSLPFRFERLIKTIFPFQQFNKQFIWKLMKRMSIFKVTGVQN